MGAGDAGIAAIIAGQVAGGRHVRAVHHHRARRERHDLKLLYTASEKPGLIGDVFVVRNDYLAAHPGQVNALLKAWGDAMADYDADPAGGQAIIEKAVGAEVGSPQDRVRRRGPLRLDEAKALMTGGDYGATIKEVKDIALAAGIMATDVDETTLIDTTYISTLVP